MDKVKSQLKSMRTIITLLVIVIVVLVVVLVTGRQTGRTLPADATDFAAIRDIERTVDVDGKLTGVETTDFTLPTGAAIDEVLVEEGTRVSKDDVLMRYTTTGFTGTVEAELVAPAAGLVTQVNIKDGQTYFNTTVPAIQITDDSELVIDLSVNENDILEVKEDQTASLIFPALSFDDHYDAKVTKVGVSPIAGSLTVNYPVTVVPEELPKDVRLGMSVEVSILTEKAEEVLSIPGSYLIEREDKYYVKTVTFVDEEQTDYELEETEVEIGLETQTFVEITSGIKEGTQIVEPTFTVERSFGFF